MIFRRTDKYGYSRYYGGGGPAFVIKVVATILVMVALVIGAAAFVVQKYMVYTENGGHLELPWAKKSSQVTPEEPGGGGLDDLVVVDNHAAESSAEAEASISAEASQSAEASASAEDSASAEASQSAEASVSAEGSESAEAIAEPAQSADTSAPAQPAQPGLWERFMNWLRSLFQTPQTTVPAADSSAEASASAPGSSSASSASSAPAVTDPGESSETTQPAQSASESQQEEPKTPASTKKPLSGGLLLQHVSIGDVKGGYAEGDVKNKKGNGIMLFMKESGGKLNFSSNQGLAEELGVNGESSTGDKIKDVVKELKGKDYYTLAYVDCFQDQKAGEESDLRLHDNDNDAWLDGEDRAWADPTSARYQNYLVALIRELDDMGFDEIVLNNACYPATGETDKLSEDCYDPGSFRDTVGGFYKKLSKELKDCKSMISLITTETAIQDGYDEATGQSLENMLQLGGRLWVDADRDKADQLSEALKAAGYPDNALGVLVGSLKDSDSFNQMNLD